MTARFYLLFSQLTSGDVQLPNENGFTSDSLTNGLQLAFGAAGGIAIVIVAYGGLRYVLSQGDPAATAKAKDTILYALIGLAVCVSAVGIISFIRATVN